MHDYAAFASELKFVVDRRLAPDIRDWVRAELSADPHAADASGDGYRTTTLYFDTEDFDQYFRRRSFARAKFRIRRYNDSPTIFLERKMKAGGRLSKRRSHADIEDLDRLTIGGERGDWSGRWFVRRLENRGLLPVCQITYDRTARVGMGESGPLRLTLDVNLRATPIDSPYFTDAPPSPVVPEWAILEMKYRAVFPALASSDLRPFQGFRLRRFVASSNAYFKQRSTPRRVLTDSWIATSCGVPLNRLPPAPAVVALTVFV